MKVVITAAAEDDLEAIAERIARDSPRRALAFVEELRACCLPLARSPRRQKQETPMLAVGSTGM